MVKRNLAIGLAALMAAAVILEYVTTHGAHGAHGAHAGPWWHSVIGFEILLGMAGAVVLAVFGKLIVFPLIGRKEDYYGEKR